MKGLVKDSGVYVKGFAAGSLAGKGGRGGTREMGDKVSIDKELMEVGRVAEGDRGGKGKEEGCEWRDQKGGCGGFL